ncbi:uncharacterized protein STEHIDRAFT_47689 [Stereum hirsutum FP-91666 SS1]|uniref:uncharacterized protein n=1 Tax=Stereum hirsutum (strain FP-91666) TaxID=721885 RepID=UPI000440E6C8|nr:uncharacterized protein STEHIDRAFT_47689 [Stereum hirsutum FP-91666 SS1]EIM91736.1 hypothetical protein STEHIDRAFT_47689 [Stereum hirsutum FP-91666 SS1]
MPELTLFEPPLSSIPDGYDWEERSVSQLSTTTTFRAGLDQRDTFLGVARCVVCGFSDSDWPNLRATGWVPSPAKQTETHEPRNALRMCPTHCTQFNTFRYFIRYMPEERKFILFNHSGKDNLAQYHGKAIALDIGDRHAPFPALFILHEMRVRAHFPFHSTVEAPDEILWQDWITSSGVLRPDPSEGLFIREGPPQRPPRPPPPPPQQQQQSSTQAGDASELPAQAPILGIGNDTIAAILGATRAMPSWRASQMEGTSWDGTAEENRAKYMALFPDEDLSKNPFPSSD